MSATDIFRKKSLERVTSPEQLNDYIRVSNPGVWMVLTAIIILLVGACIWGIFGQIHTKIKAPAIVTDGKIICYVGEEAAASIGIGMPVDINDSEYTVEAVSNEPVIVDGSFPDYALHIGTLHIGEWVYKVTVKGELSDGIYETDIIVESISPISFVFN